MDKIVDSTRLLRLVKSKVDCEAIEKDISKLDEWATSEFQCRDKCKVMHNGEKNPKFNICQRAWYCQRLREKTISGF